MAAFKWVLATEWKCDDDEIYEQIIQESDFSYNTISESWADYMDFASAVGINSYPSP